MKNGRNCSFLFTHILHFYTIEIREKNNGRFINFKFLVEYIWKFLFFISEFKGQVKFEKKLFF